MTAPSQSIRAIVRMPCGFIIMDVPFWQSDAHIIRDALATLPEGFAPKPDDCSIERTRS